LSLEWTEEQTPTEIIKEAVDKLKIDALYVLYSGGKDSGCVQHFVKHNFPKLYKGSVFTNVGLGAQATRQFVLDYCRRENYKLFMTWPREIDRFYNLVMKYGFATPKSHRQWMGALKYHSWYYFMKWRYADGERAAFVSGVRKKESVMRQKVKLYTRTPTDAIRSRYEVFVKPFFYKNGTQLWDYYNEHGVEKSPVYTWLNRSGECYCGAFLQEWELKMMEKYDPFAFDTIKWLEKQIPIHGTPFAKKHSKYGGFQKTEDVEMQTTLGEFDVDEELCGESCVV